MNFEPSFSSPQSRRHFLKGSTTFAVGSALLPYISVKENAFAANSDTLKVGLIGCGGRGSGAASQALNADPNVVLHAVGDMHEDKLQTCLKSLREDATIGSRVKVTPETTFIGLDAYKKVLESGVDVVLLATPPGFRPFHLRAAVEAGKHIFCEKPMATDAPGVRSVMASAKLAKEKKLALVAGFCWRYNFGERELMKRVHGGEIGDPMSLYTVYNTGALWVNPRKPGQTDLQYQLRNWYYFTWLSGDHIVEQAVHSIDKMAWAMQDAKPVKCVAHGGRQVRTGPDYGHIFDHFSVVYEYASGARGYHFCRQQPGCASDNSDYFIGTKGVAKIKAFGPLTISGGNAWKFSGERPNMYQVEHNELFASIRKGQPLNDGEWMAQSTMTAIMGRMAAYTGQEITWEQALNSEENLTKQAVGQEGKEGDPEFRLDLKMYVPPVAIPGQTKFA